jgi:hypothetical protein
LPLNFVLEYSIRKVQENKERDWKQMEYISVLSNLFFIPVTGLGGP